MKIIQKALYGNVALHRGFCHKCKQMALIIDNRFQCCLLEAGPPERERKKRISETPDGYHKQLPPKIKRKILDDQDYCCIYCGVNLHGKIIHYDHFVPWAYSQNNAETNMLASCNRCNLVKSDMYFQTIEEARIYILGKRGMI